MRATQTLMHRMLTTVIAEELANARSKVYKETELAPDRRWYIRQEEFS